MDCNVKVKHTERGWAGHFCCANRCLFRRNTLLEYGGIKIVVSTVGAMLVEDKNGKRRFEQIGLDRYYETMAFHSDTRDSQYHDADVSRPAYFESNWCIGVFNVDYQANDMHEAVVAEISQRLEHGEKFEVDIEA